MKRTISAIGLSAVVVLSAHAQIDLSASVSGLTFELIDLDPNDNVTPTLTFSSGLGNASTYISTNQLTESRTVQLSGPSQTISRSLTTGPTSSEIHFEGANNGTYAMGSSIHSDLKVIEYEDYPLSSASTEWSTRLSLSPHTELKISTHATVHASYDLSIADQMFSNVDAVARLGLVGGQQDLIFASDVGVGKAAAFSESIDRMLTISFVNNQTSSQSAILHVETLLNQSVSTVPEPSTSGLISCGLLLLGILARARRAGWHSSVDANRP